MTSRFFVAAAFYLCAAISIVCFEGQAKASGSYPDRPIRLVVPWPPGSGGDIAGRMVANKLTELLGKSVYVDNRGGAGGTIGSHSARREAADGYTLILGNSTSHGSAQVLFPNAYNAATDFTPISLIYRNMLAVAVKRDLPVATIPELVAYAKARPGELGFGTPGMGTPHQLAGEILKQKAGIEMIHLPYQGGGPAMRDLVGGHIPVVVGALSTALENHRAGRIKILALTEAERLKSLPDVPIVADYYAPFDFYGWGAILGPPGLPDAIVARLNAAIRTALESDDLRKIMSAAGFTPEASSPEQLRERIESETSRWEDVVKSGVKIRK